MTVLTPETAAAEIVNLMLVSHDWQSFLSISSGHINLPLELLQRCPPHFLSRHLPKLSSLTLASATCQGIRHNKLDILGSLTGLQVVKVVNDEKMLISSSRLEAFETHQIRKLPGHENFYLSLKLDNEHNLRMMS